MRFVFHWQRLQVLIPEESVEPAAASILYARVASVVVGTHSTRGVTSFFYFSSSQNPTDTTFAQCTSVLYTQCIQSGSPPHRRAIPVKRTVKELLYNRRLLPSRFIQTIRNTQTQVIASLPNRPSTHTLTPEKHSLQSAARFYVVEWGNEKKNLLEVPHHFFLQIRLAIFASADGFFLSISRLGSLLNSAAVPTRMVIHVTPHHTGPTLGLTFFTFSDSEKPNHSATPTCVPKCSLRRR